MKRSEMINKLLKYFRINGLGRGYEGYFDEDDYFIDLDGNDADEIIKVIEEAGMLPPLSKSKEKELEKDIYKHNDANPVLYADCMDYYFDWEPEDEG